MNNRDQVTIVEMGPRDGLQNESKIIPTDLKYRFVKNLEAAGLTSLEVTSFVHPKSIPQMSDAQDLMTMLNKDESHQSKVFYWALVPNLKGYERAKQCGLKGFAFFTAASETFSQKNTQATIEQTFDRLDQFTGDIKANSGRLRGYISTVFGCPYEGKVSSKKVIEVAQQLLKRGVEEISLGDTIGVARPRQVKELIRDLKSILPLNKLAMHFHDTRGMAIANILASVDEGIRTFDSSAAGLGGCPYALGATGNVATEDLIYLFDDLGLQHNLDLDKIIKASAEILEFLGKKSPSRFHQVYINSAKQ